MPGIIPRVRALFTRGFGYVAFLMACVYNMVRLLPNGHPYLNPANIGKFGLRHVIAAAANNLVISRNNLDQLVIFAATLMALMILLVQLGLIFYAVIGRHLIGHAMAIPIPGGMTSLFVTPDPQGGATTVTDIAFMLLDQVFGVPNLFVTAGGMKTAVGATLPLPFHIALQDLFKFYSLGLLLIGVLIFLYFALVIVAETATTGSPFGQRFKNGWVPIRLIMAVGLLVPLNYGLNSAQYIVLYAAKYGSSFATNSWIIFNQAVQTGAAGSAVFGANGGYNPAGERTSLIARPVTPSLGGVVEFMTLVHACEYLAWKLDTNPSTQGVTGPVIPANFYIQPYFAKNPTTYGDTNSFQQVTAGTTYDDALKFYDNGDILIRFGTNGNSTDSAKIRFSDWEGNIEATCGEIRIKIGDLANKDNADVGGPNEMQSFYFDMIKMMWFGDGGDNLIKKIPYHWDEVAIDNEGPGVYWQCDAALTGTDLPTASPACQTQRIGSEAKQTLIDQYNTILDAEVTDAWDKENKKGMDIQMKPEIMNRGWAGAGIWYNVIAQLNGGFINSVTNTPMPISMPLVMKQTLDERTKEDKEITGNAMYTPVVNGRTHAINHPDPYATTKATVMGEFYKYWNDDGVDQNAAGKTVTGEGVRDFIETFFGAKGLFAMQGYNSHIHPLAQLTALGKTLVDSAIFCVTVSTLSGFGTPLATKIGLAGADSGLLQVASSLYSSIGLLALIAGLILFYVLPFLPFLYFYFAVGTWVMSIFEAMVGVPLWALAHLRLDGEGLPGDFASNGYFLIFEIFLRPILSVFGLIAAIVIFAAQIRILSAIWSLVMSNLTGDVGAPGAVGIQSSPRDILDQFCFSVIYVMFCYMMATTSFKLIDRIPDNILRFMGAGVSTFSDINPDATEGLTRYVAFGGLTIGGQVEGAVNTAAQGFGGALAGEIPTPTPPTPSAPSG